jgi:ribokinase
MKDLLVIGVASQDVLHLNYNQSSCRVDTIGGAGLYTALAAAFAGANVTLFAPRPDPLPSEFNAVTRQVAWLGPSCEVADMPRLEIAHYGNDQAKLIGASWGAEAELHPNSLPNNLADFQCVHVAALSSAQRQLEFALACRVRGVRKVSAGTYGRLAFGETDTVLALIRACDTFFLNENEAVGVFGALESARAPESTMLFITRGSRGARVLHQQTQFDVPAPIVDVVDPTGAGDTFCGVVLTRLAAGDSVTQAVSQAVNTASMMIARPGPEALLCREGRM